MGNFLDKYAASILKDQFGEKLRRALVPHAFDGSEVFGVIDTSLRENKAAAATIRNANFETYCGAVALDIVIEVIGKLHEDGNL
jgi:hypothetical protein